MELEQVIKKLAGPYAEKTEIKENILYLGYIKIGTIKENAKPFLSTKIPFQENNVSILFHKKICQITIQNTHFGDIIFIFADTFEVNIEDVTIFTNIDLNKIDEEIVTVLNIEFSKLECIGEPEKPGDKTPYFIYKVPSDGYKIIQD